MATLPALVNAITEVDGREKKTIEHTARLIREAGFIPSGKRGGGAAHMDYTAAANLLIGLNAADNPAGAVKAISLMRALKAFNQNIGETPNLLKEISDLETFGEALERVIEVAPKLTALGWALIREAYNPPSRKIALMHFQNFIRDGRLCAFYVRLRRNYAEMEIITPELKHETQWKMTYHCDVSEYRDQFESVDIWDRQVTVEFSLRTLLKVWACVNDHNETLGDFIETRDVVG